MDIYTKKQFSLLHDDERSRPIAPTTHDGLILPYRVPQHQNAHSIPAFGNMVGGLQSKERDFPDNFFLGTDISIFTTIVKQHLHEH